MKNIKRHLGFSAITAAMCIAGIQPGLALTENARACSADAAIVHAVPADWPTADWGHNFSGTTVVKISLAADGAVDNPVVVKSSGIPLLDQAARSAATRQIYTPEVQNCTAVGGSYLVRFDFVP
jgi:TonB family protein